MPQPLTLQVTLSEDVRKFVRQRMETGNYTSENQVIEESLIASREEMRDLERWLVEVAVPAYHEILADPSGGIPFEDVKAELEEDLKSIRETHE